MSLKQQLTVSIIIPTYNRANMVTRAIQSLLEQTLVPDEIIVVDDGSTDETPQILAQYSKPVIVIRQDNKDRSAARNTGLKAAKGEILAFLDSDDTLPRDSIEKRVLALQNKHDCVVVYNNVAIIDSTEKIIGDYIDIFPGPRPSGMIFNQLARHNFIPIHAFMFYRSAYEAIGGFDESLRYLEDFDFLIRLAACYSFFYIDEPLSYYHFHNEMTTKSEDQLMVSSSLKVYARVFSMPAFYQLSALEKASIYSVHGSRYAMLGLMAEAREWYGKSIKTSPSILRSYLLLIFTLFGHFVFKKFISAMKQIRRYKPTHII